MPTGFADPDTTTDTIEELDFEPACTKGRYAHPPTQCPHSADWMILLRCGHHVLYCESHYQEMLAAIPRAFFSVCCQCPQSGMAGVWTSGEGIASVHRIR